MRDKHWGLLVMLAILGFLVGDQLAWSNRRHGSAFPRRTLPRETAARLEPTAAHPPPSTSPAQSPARAAEAHAVEVNAALEVTIPARPEVARYVRHFSLGNGRSSVSIWLQRAGTYAAMIRETLQRYGLPRELLAVAIVESGMQPAAISPVGATGMWQFMADTARSYALHVGDDFDERRDPKLATDAAARHLRDLYVEFRDWPLALAAYNAGRGRIREQMELTASDDFWALTERGTLARETVDYVPKVLAMVSILGQLPSHGFAPIVGDPLSDDYARLELTPGVALARVARGLGMPNVGLRQLNPAIVGGRIPAGGDRTRLTIPSDRARLAQLLVVPLAWGVDDVRLLARVERLVRGAPVPSARAACVIQPCAPTGSDADWERLLDAVVGTALKTYQVRRGDTPQKVADRFGVDPSLLMEQNGLSDPRRIRVGQLLRLPELERHAL